MTNARCKPKNITWLRNEPSIREDQLVSNLRSKMQIQSGHNIGVCIVIDIVVIFIGAHDAIYVIALATLVPVYTTCPKFSRSICQITANPSKPLEIVGGQEMLTQCMPNVGCDVLFIFNYFRCIWCDINTSECWFPRISILVPKSCSLV